MGKLGMMELILVLGVPVGIFMFGFFVGRLSGRNAAHKEYMNRRNLDS